MIAIVVVCMGSKATLLDETITLVISFSYQMVASYIYTYLAVYKMKHFTVSKIKVCIRVSCLLKGSRNVWIIAIYCGNYP